MGNRCEADILSERVRPLPVRREPRRPIVAIALAALAVIAGVSCAARAPAPLREIGSAGTVALEHFRIADNIADREALSASVEPMLRTSLERRGFAVVPAASVEALWRSAAADVGDLFDADTGAVHKEEWEAAQRTVYRRLEKEYGVDAVLYLSVITETIHFPTDTYVKLCSRRYVPTWWGPSPAGLPTLVVGTCMEAKAYDMEGRRIHDWVSGVEVITVYSDQTRIVRPYAERFKDLDLVRDSIDGVVAALEESILNGPLGADAEAATD